MKFKTGTIKQKVFINAKPDEVYDAFLDAKKHASFTGSRATCDPRVGGKMTASDGYITGKNLKLVKNKMIVQEWKTSEWPDDYPPSRLELSFKGKEDGTELTMKHSKVPKEQVKMYAEGWITYYWEPLKEYFRNR